MKMDVARGLTQVAKRGYQIKVRELASLRGQNYRQLTIVDGKVQGVKVGDVIDALPSGVAFTMDSTTLRLGKKH